MMAWQLAVILAVNSYGAGVVTVVLVAARRVKPPKARPTVPAQRPTLDGNVRVVDPSCLPRSHGTGRQS